MNHTPADEAAILAALLQYPGVCRAAVQRQPDEPTTLARVVPWGRRTDRSDDEIIAEIAGINPHETRFLHDEIFTEESYLAGGVVLRENSIVFDVGANIGMFALFVGARCPSAQVFSFEPIPEAFHQLRRNLYRHGVHAKLFDYGLSDTDRRATFNYFPTMSIMSCRDDYAEFDKTELVMRYVHNARECGPDGREEHLSTLEELAREGFTPTAHEVMLRRLSPVIEETGVNRIDLLKIDVQRAELDVLIGVEDRHWPLIRQITMEVHDEPGTETEGRLDIVTKLLRDHGFQVATAEEAVMRDTGRYALQAIRPEYHTDPRPVVARAGSAGPLDPQEIRQWLAARLPDGLCPDHVRVVDELGS